jgi:hypothetical protein
MMQEKAPSLESPWDIGARQGVSMSDYPATMKAVLLRGHGGFDQLEFREDVPQEFSAKGHMGKIVLEP